MIGELSVNQTFIGEPRSSTPWQHRKRGFGEEFTVLSRHPTIPPRIYYTCMNSWMQLGLLRDLLHLHELVIGNAAFISDSHVGVPYGVVVYHIIT